jgi:RecB family endonuclease NucS
MVDFKSYIHDHLMKIIEEGLLDEEDVEDLLEYKLCESGYLLQGRQHSLENGGRIDLWYKKDDVSYVFEVKKARAEVGALNQIQAYIDRIKEKVKTSRLRGIIICETASKQLRDALDKARYDISIREYMFSVEFNFDVD